MSTQMVQFNPGGMPANISNLFGGMVGIEDLTSGAEAAFPILSIKGKVFRVKHGGTERTIQRDGLPLQYLDMIIVKANKNLSKLYYDKAYAEGDDAPPTCSSASGVAPDTGVQTPQSTSCATCPQNVWGSKITPQGTKTKACSDMRRLALIPHLDLTCQTWGAPLLLRVPAASLQGLSEYARTVLGGKPYSAVVTRISFDPLAAYPKLTFAPVRWLNDAEAPHVMHWMNNPIVGRIIGTDIDPSAPNVQQRVIPIQPVAATPAPQPAVHGYIAPAVTKNAPTAIETSVEFQGYTNQVAERLGVIEAPAVAPAPAVNPLAGLSNDVKAAINAVGGADTPAGKAIIVTLAPAVAKALGLTTIPTAEKPKRTRKAAAPAPASEFIPAAPTVVTAASPPQASSNNLLAGVDELLNGLENLRFDD